MIPAREELADLYRIQDRRADEIEQLQLLAGLDRDHVERQVAVGMAHARAGHWDLAVLTLSGALERNPNEPESTGRRARCGWNGRAKTAPSWAKRATRWRSPRWARRRAARRSLSTAAH